MRKITLYIIDEEEEVVNALKHVFKPNKRYRVRCHTTVAGVWDDLDRYPPQLIICDYLLPECDGIKLLRDIKQLFPGVRSILLTGEAFGPQIVAAIEEGVFKLYFSKPWDQAKLEETMAGLAREVAKEMES